jgi:GT2 family glycosyltransferase
MGSLKNLTIIIATFNRKVKLTKVLTQINTQLNHLFKVNIIVIDDGSTDGTEAWISLYFPQVFIIKGDGNWWWTKSMNMGFKKAVEKDADFVLILNDDSEINPDYLQKLFDDYSSLPENSILGSMSISIEQFGAIEMSGTKSFNPLFLKAKQYLEPFTILNGSHNGVKPTTTLCGRGTLIPCLIFDKIGFYDEKLLQYGSDDEFVLRARKHGFSTFISWNARVYNYTYLTSESSSIKKITFWRFTANFFRPNTANSLRKDIHLYLHYGVPVFLPIYLIYSVLGSYKSHFFNFSKLKR